MAELLRALEENEAALRAKAHEVSELVRELSRVEGERRQLVAARRELERRALTLARAKQSAAAIPAETRQALGEQLVAGVQHPVHFRLGEQDSRDISIKRPFESAEGPGKSAVDERDGSASGDERDGSASSDETASRKRAK